jgi:hypothetical protein
MMCRILSNTKDTSLHDQASNAILDAVVKAGYLKVHVTDFVGHLRMPPTYSALPCSTTIIDISAADWTPPDRKVRTELRRAEREQVTIQPFCRESHMEGFIRLMTGTERRHDRDQKYSPQFFEALAELGSRDDRIIWLWCEHDSQPVVSQICLIEGETALGWQVGYDKAFPFLKANQYMLWSLIAELKRREVQRLNLGATPSDAHGVTHFKSKWGGERYDYNCYVYKSALGRWL